VGPVSGYIWDQSPVSKPRSVEPGSLYGSVKFHSYFMRIFSLHSTNTLQVYSSFWILQTLIHTAQGAQHEETVLTLVLHTLKIPVKVSRNVSLPFSLFNSSASLFSCLFHPGSRSDQMLLVRIRNWQTVRELTAFIKYWKVQRMK
jgi:hypothetical protein